MKKGLTPVKQVRHLTGFTIVELIIVIAIIGILATIATVSFARSKMRARDSIRVTDLNSVAQALLVYKETEGEYPDNICVTPPPTRVSYFSGEACNISGKRSLDVLVSGGYISSSFNNTTFVGNYVGSALAAGSGLPHDPKLDPSDPKSDYWYFDSKLVMSNGVPILAAKLEIPNSKGWAPYESGIPSILAECVQKPQSSGSAISDSSQPVITYDDPVRYCVRVTPY